MDGGGIGGFLPRQNLLAVAMGYLRRGAMSAIRRHPIDNVTKRLDREVAVFDFRRPLRPTEQPSEILGGEPFSCFHSHGWSIPEVSVVPHKLLANCLAVPQSLPGCRQSARLATACSNAPTPSSVGLPKSLSDPSSGAVHTISHAVHRNMTEHDCVRHLLCPTAEVRLSCRVCLYP